MFSEEEEEIEIKLPSIKIPKITKYELINFFIALALSIAVFVETYTTALYGVGANTFISDEVYYAGIASKMVAYMFGSQAVTPFIPTSLFPAYWNLEHPPLAKYIIALSIMAFNNGKPISWRFPSILMSTLMPFISYYAVFIYYKNKYVKKDPKKKLNATLLAFLTAVVFPLESIIHYEGALALLDVYASFFVLLTLAFALNRKWYLSSFFLGLAIASKETALPLLIALPLVYWFSEKGVAKKKIGKSIFLFIFPIIILLITYIPLAVYFGGINGFKTVIMGQINGLHFDMQTRKVGPTPSTPLQWFFAQNSQYLSLVMAGNTILKDMKAQMNPFIEVPVLGWVVSLIVYAFDLLFSKKSVKGILSILRDPAVVFYVTELLAFYADYMAGNHSLYSMYSIIFVPMSAFIFGELLYTVLLPILRGIKIGK